MNSSGKVRSSNLDLLRIVCILFIVFGHMISQSVEGQIGPENTGAYVFCLLMGNGARLCINCFVMISGWFLIRQSFVPERFLRTWWITFFYSVLFSFLAIGVWHAPVSLLYLGQAFLPIIGRPEWYMCEYLLLLLFSPFLNRIVNGWDRASVRRLLLLMTVGMPGIATFFPMNYTAPFFSELMWFLYLYMLMGYLRIYEVNPFRNAGGALTAVFGGYGLICILKLLGVVLAGTKYAAIGSVCVYLGSYYKEHYEALPGFIASLGLFFLFLGLRMPEVKWISMVGRSTGVIYIIHQVPLMWRSDDWTIWNGIFHVKKYIGTGYLIWYMLLVAVEIILTGIILDCVQKRLIEDPLMRTGLVCRLKDALLHFKE